MPRRHDPAPSPDGTRGALYIDAHEGAPAMRLRIRESDGLLREYDVHRNEAQRRDGEADYWVIKQKGESGE